LKKIILTAVLGGIGATIYWHKVHKPQVAKRDAWYADYAKIKSEN
jgi:hypothetical protein